MLRDKSLIPLSHQHQRALALCVRIDRAQPIPAKDLQAWQAEIAQLFEQEIGIHFATEEDVIFPAAREFAELIPLIEELLAEHNSLRKSFRQAEKHNMLTEDLITFGQRLSSHIRKEERSLFERMQQLLQPPELASLGIKLEAALKGATQSCILTSEATKLKPKINSPVR
ncbi:MAG: hemerythrin domain-containing protein [Candidatus Sulfotelmatobacter sp.]